MDGIYNVKITSTFLGVEDHGIFTFDLFLSGEGFGVAYGSFALSGRNEKTGECGYSKTGIEAIALILKTVGVHSWEELTGALIRIEVLDSRVVAIGNLMEDKWFSYKEFYDAHEDED